MVSLSCVAQHLVPGVFHLHKSLQLKQWSHLELMTSDSCPENVILARKNSFTAQANNLLYAVAQLNPVFKNRLFTFF
jgi:hypothetical protein